MSVRELAARIIAVTHRLESVSRADQIIVMERGRVVEVRSGR
jgi:ABC-type multidrug transport system fused ATPase/permease subunit